MSELDTSIKGEKNIIVNISIKDTPNINYNIFNNFRQKVHNNNYCDMWQIDSNFSPKKDNFVIMSLYSTNDDVITIQCKLDKPVDTNTILLLSNSKTVTILAGEVEGFFTTPIYTLSDASNSNKDDYFKFIDDISIIRIFGSTDIDGSYVLKLGCAEVTPTTYINTVLTYDKDKNIVYGIVQCEIPASTNEFDKIKISSVTIMANTKKYIINLDDNLKGIFDFIPTSNLTKVEVVDSNCNCEEVEYGFSELSITKTLECSIKIDNLQQCDYNYINRFPIVSMKLVSKGEIHNYLVNLNKCGIGFFSVEMELCDNTLPTIDIESINGVDINEIQEDPIEIIISNKPSILNNIDLTQIPANIINNGIIIDLKNISFDTLTITLEELMNLGSTKNINIICSDINKLYFKDTINYDGTKNIWQMLACWINHTTKMNKCIYVNSGCASLEIKVEYPIQE